MSEETATVFKQGASQPDYAKAEVGTRLIAALIDAVLQWVVGLIPIVGGLIGAAYMLLRDGLPDGQSLGKKVMKLRVVTLDGKKADYVASCKRNVIFAIPSIITIIPLWDGLSAEFWAWLLPSLRSSAYSMIPKAGG